METILAVLVGILVAASVYLMLARNILRFLFGLILLSNAANLTIFIAGRLTRATPPLVANALPQALILTAIVIGFGLLAFALALVLKAYRTLGTLDTDAMREAEPLPIARTAPNLPGGDRTS